MKNLFLPVLVLTGFLLALSRASVHGAFVPAGDGRSVHLTATNVMPGQTFQSSLVIESCGDETAVGASVVINRQWLDYVSFTPGTSAAGATLNVNTTQASSGRIGVVFSLPIGTSFAAGPRELVRFTFRASTNNGSTSITFGNVPVFQEVSDSDANTLTTIFAPTPIIIGTPPPPPLRLLNPERQPAGYFRLRLSNTNGSPIVASRLPQIDVMTSTNVGLAFSNWARVTNTATIVNGMVQLDDTTGTNARSRFYRAVERP